MEFARPLALENFESGELKYLTSGLFDGFF